MKKHIKFLSSFLLLVLLLSSCCDRNDIAITFVLSEPLEAQKYPSYFQEISIPFETECEGNCTEILFKPISVCRLDISKKEEATNAWYFQDIGDNTVDFSTLYLETYFKDSIPPAYLFEPQGDKMQLESFLKKNKTNSFIYSEESDLEEYQGVKIFSSTKNLQKTIQESACKNTEGKVYVLINPKIQGETPIPEIPKSSPNEITKLFARVGDRNVSPDIRINLAEEDYKVLAENCMVKEFGHNETLVAMTPVREYLEKIALYRTLENIEVTAALKNENGKYWEVSVVEHHLNDPK